MPQFLFYDPSQPEPQQILGMFDTDHYDYSGAREMLGARGQAITVNGLPPTEQLVKLTADQVDRYLLNPQGFRIAGGALTTYRPPPPPPPTLAQQAQAMLEAGIGIISASNPELNGTYPVITITPGIGQSALLQANGILAALANGLTFPGGVIPWPDTSGTPHIFTPDAFRGLCQAMLYFSGALTPIIVANRGQLPPQPFTIP